MFYQLNKIRTRTRTTKPSLTDQSQADSTDINIMLKGVTFGNLEYGKGAADAPQETDYTNLPDDYRDAIEFGRQLPKFRGDLPPALRDIPIPTLLNLTPAELMARLKPAETPPKKDEEPPK